jgi:glutamyl-Q tRNA(Asp) synthetase
MEDLDPVRSRPACADEILSTLESFALTWDGEILRQSRRSEAYAEALTQLSAQGLLFECSCSRRELFGERYPGTCRERASRGPAGLTSSRFRVDPAATVHFVDSLQGPQVLRLDALGDVVIRRRDGVFAYQLAVVVDDAAQGVTHVVRGADLLASTGWQIALQQALGLPTPSYSHLPLVLDATGQKLSKSRRSLALARASLSAQLREALCLLRLPPPAELSGAPPATLLAWAIPRWPPAGLFGLREIPGP